MRMSTVVSFVQLLLLAAPAVANANSLAGLTGVLGAGAACYSLNSNWTPAWANIVGYWKFNEAAGTSGAGSVTDSSGKGNHGTPSGTINFGATGRVGAAAAFAGGMVAVPPAANLDLSSISIAFWINPTAIPVGYADHIVAKWTGTADANYVLYFFGTTSGAAAGKFMLYANAGGVWQVVSAAYLVPLNTWTHYAVTYSAALGGQVYVNGRPYGGASAVRSALATNAASLRIMNSSLLNGRVDELAVWNTVLTRAQVRMLYDQQSCGKN